MTAGAARSDWIAGGSLFAVQAAWPFAALGLVLALLFIAPGAVIEVSAVDFAIVTVFLGGGAAWLSGQAIAETWRPYVQLVGYMLLLAAAVRFIHFALFEGTLLSPAFYAVDVVILTALASLGYRVTRARQMATQYGWLYQRNGLIGWRPRSGR